MRRVLPFLAALFTAGPAAAQVDLLPNLQPLPPLSPYLVRSFSPSGTFLRFGTIAFNNGAGPVEIRGGDVSDDGLTQEVWQRIYDSQGGFTDSLAGTFIHHEQHGHIHFEDYAFYTLEGVDTPFPVQGVNNKTSFCLMDTQKVNGRLDGAPKKAVYTTCGSERQGISVGWGDEYHAGLPGQSIDVTGFPAGTYRLSMVVDPFNQLIEIDDNDNVASMLLFIDPETLTLRVVEEQNPGDLVRIDSLVPAVMNKGEVREVVISGEGFDAGLAVGFSGGGPAVSNVIYESGNTIRATVTVGNGGPARIRTFDLKVGPAVLRDALTILP